MRFRVLLSVVSAMILSCSDDSPSKDRGDSGTLDPAQLPPPDANADIIPNIDSAILKLKKVEGAKDYRVFAMDDGVEILTDAEGHGVVNGATIFCAGQRQRGAPALPTPEVMREIEISGLTEKKLYVVEAIDRLCPFPGLLGQEKTQFNIGSPDALPELIVPVPVETEASIRERYGNMIFNGQGGAMQPGQPADPVAPKVLERWTVELSPISEAEASARATKDFFSTFSRTKQPSWIQGDALPGRTFANGDGTFHAPDGRGYSIAVLQDEDFTFYGANLEWTGQKNILFYDRGRLNILLPDAVQDVMGTVMAVPRKVAHVASDSYLHITFESPTNSTARRYWWLSVCGPETAGETFEANGIMKEWVVLMPNFWGADGLNPSDGAWNCLIVFPHDGVPYEIPAGAGNPQSSVIVLVHKANTALRESSVNVSPPQLPDTFARGWYRQQKGSVVQKEGVLDDYIQMSPRVRFDMYVSRKRLVMYVNGEQRICNDFGPESLTMAEAAVGFNDTLYHSSAEHTELTVDYYDRSGQLHYLQNLVFADQHTFDNVGFEEGVGLPSSYKASDCYTHTP